MKFWREKQVDLPTNPEELDIFMDTIIKTYGLPDNMDTRDSICTLIMHAPQSVSKAPLSHFAQSVKKSMANRAAYDKLAEYRDKRKQEQEAKDAETKAAETANWTQPAPSKTPVN
jgi:hypothetical protein